MKKTCQLPNGPTPKLSLFEVTGLTANRIWTTPSGAASIGFHVRHAAGSLDRLFTYARGEQLSSEQRAALAAEGEPDMTPNVGASLLAAFHDAVERALAQLRNTENPRWWRLGVLGARSCRPR